MDPRAAYPGLPPTGAPPQQVPPVPMAGTPPGYAVPPTYLHQYAAAQAQGEQLRRFWAEMKEDAAKAGIDPLEFKNQQLPLARIKKIMKSDEDVRMISAEAPVLFAKACEYFILELTLRAWGAAEETKRRTLQRSDIATAIARTDIFDFLVDIVPREEANPPPTGTPSGGAPVAMYPMAPPQFGLPGAGPMGAMMAQPAAGAVPSSLAMGGMHNTSSGPAGLPPQPGNLGLAPGGMMYGALAGPGGYPMPPAMAAHFLQAQQAAAAQQAVQQAAAQQQAVQQAAAQQQAVQQQAAAQQAAVQQQAAAQQAAQQQAVQQQAVQHTLHSQLQGPQPDGPEGGSTGQAVPQQPA